jgi:hypothetical protein
MFRDYGAGKRYDSVLRWIVWRLPKRFIMWSYIRVVAHATTGEYGDTIVVELTAMDALKRWPTQ